MATCVNTATCLRSIRTDHCCMHTTSFEYIYYVISELESFSAHNRNIRFDATTQCVAEVVCIVNLIFTPDGDIFKHVSMQQGSHANVAVVPH